MLSSYDSVLAGWRLGELERRFPDEEDWRELWTRLAAALQRVAADSTAAQRPSWRTEALSGRCCRYLAAGPDSGVDLGTGELAELDVALTADEPASN